MTPLPHRYEVHLTGAPTGYADLSADGRPVVRAAPPKEFGGPGDAWSPEHLLLAAVETCFLFTLRAVARAMKVDFVALDVDAVGTVDRPDGVTRFTAITLVAAITIARGSDRDQVMRLLEKTERACLVSASLSTPVRVEPTIIEA